MISSIDFFLCAHVHLIFVSLAADPMDQDILQVADSAANMKGRSMDQDRMCFYRQLKNFYGKPDQLFGSNEAMFEHVLQVCHKSVWCLQTQLHMYK